MIPRRRSSCGSRPCQAKFRCCVPAPAANRPESSECPAPAGRGSRCRSSPVRVELARAIKGGSPAADHLPQGRHRPRRFLLYQLRIVNLAAGDHQRHTRSSTNHHAGSHPDAAAFPATAAGAASGGAGPASASCSLAPPLAMPASPRCSSAGGRAQLFVKVPTLKSKYFSQPQHLLHRPQGYPPRTVPAAGQTARVATARTVICRSLPDEPATALSLAKLLHLHSIALPPCHLLAKSPTLRRSKRTC